MKWFRTFRIITLVVISNSNGSDLLSSFLDDLRISLEKKCGRSAEEASHAKVGETAMARQQRRKTPIR
ncbi:hypothetical protein [Paenibacillus baekrokdamisoli]|uniref:hypothetical protein n=1 Tax=Paenibacillus baekrokdamisoli TaxID=1712516 RepID=UPI001E367A70|nr:hypothetical protein [Paenibacillus baekrokdamisoli]